MTRNELVNNIINRLNKIKEANKVDFNPADFDVDGTIREFKIVKCVNDENGRNENIVVDNYYEIENIDSLNYRLHGIRVWQSIKFFNEIEIIKILCHGDYYTYEN